MPKLPSAPTGARSCARIANETIRWAEVAGITTDVGGAGIAMALTAYDKAASTRRPYRPLSIFSRE
jgi:hypothetical protein